MATDKPILPPPTLAQYPELILGAIEALDEKNGADTAAISKHIESVYGELPAAHSTLLSHHLNKMKSTGEVVMYKNNYLKPDPTRSSRPGPGRPPKAKVSPSADAASPPRKRGRPAKAVRLEGDVQASSPRPRGRPKKVVDSEPTLSEPRPRGRPAKVVVPSTSSPVSRPRGRPAKAKNVIATPPPSFSARGRGRPPKNVIATPPSISGRGRGRPPKNLNAEAASISPRSRGRPPKKNVGLEGSVSVPLTNTPSLSERKRGRPKKTEKSGDETKNEPTLQLSGTKRGRGRPPKAKPV